MIGSKRRVAIIVDNGGWRLLTIDLTDSAEDEGIACGGTMQVLIEKV